MHRKAASYSLGPGDTERSYRLMCHHDTDKRNCPESAVGIGRKEHGQCPEKLSSHIRDTVPTPPLRESGGWKRKTRKQVPIK